MEKLFAAIVIDHNGTRVFYVAEATVEAAKARLLSAHSDLSGQDVDFRELPASIAEPLGLTDGQVKEWPLGTLVQLTGLTGTGKR